MKPIVIAHRGASHDFAEHTYEAYVSAIESGADGLECDVRLTADNVLLCWHDSDLKRTSDGKGRISKLTWEEIRGVDSGSWHRAGRAAKPLLFSDLLHLAMEAGKSLSIETKHPVRSGGEIERALAEILAPYLPVKPSSPALAKFRMMSFSRFAVKRWQKLVPSIPAVALIGRDRFIVGAPVVGPGIDLIRRDPSLVERLHEQGREVHVWTVDGLADIALCLKLGVDAIITNRPADVVAAIGD
jgi:glycerophosphoryl diester phosphodiesterase